MTLEDDRLTFRDALDQLEALRTAAEALEQTHQEDLARIPDTHRASARNLLHYAAVRQHDIRSLQRMLHALGLSSLGRMEAYVLASINAVTTTLRRLLAAEPGAAETPVDFEQGRVLLHAHTDALFGPPPPSRQVRVMVTLGVEAIEEPDLLDRLLIEGMNVMRINCSKNGPDVWMQQVAHLRRAEARTGLPAKVMFDLSGPNPRTGPVRHGKKTSPIRLTPGDRLEIVAEQIEGRAAQRGPDGTLHTPAQISCTLPEVIADLRRGERFYLDDGACAGTVREADPRRALIEVTATQGTFKLKPAKGMNFPDSDLRLPSLTDKDRRDLDAIVGVADIVGLSFVRRPSDVDALIDALEASNAKPGMVLKIETVQGFERLPGVLLHALRRPPVGIMVARGDMGVELGFDRLAEAQEEVLWMSEAAHVPTIWATQVLESLTKTGQPSRAEVTDAAMAGRAECVMLNRGAYVEDSVRFLSNILERMEAHQTKKLSWMRKLGISTGV